MEIVEVDWGIANRFSDGVIEINRHLRIENPKLYRSVLRHELQNIEDTFSWKELKHDLINDEKSHPWQFLKFMIRHPKSLTQFLPFYYSRKRGFVLDVNLSLMYLILVIIIFSSIGIGLKFF